MANPRLTYNSKTIDFPFLPAAIRCSALNPRTVNMTITGKHETIRLPHIDIPVRAEWPIMDSSVSGHPAANALINWHQWAQSGQAWALALDSAKTVDTLVAVEAAAGDTLVWVDNPVGVTVGQVYKLINGPNMQLLTVSAVDGDRISFTSTSLDFDLGVGAILRDQFYFPGLLRNPSAPLPLEYLDPAQSNPWPPTRYIFAPEFFEDIREEITMIFKQLTADASGANSATAQPWFPSAGSVTVAPNTSYFFDGYLRLSRAAGTTSHTTSLLFAGTATLFSLVYKALCNTGDTVANIAGNVTAIEVATEIVVKAASTSATEQVSVYVRGLVRFNAGGTFISQFNYSAAPGGAPTVLTGSCFRLWPEGSASLGSRGTWS